MLFVPALVSLLGGRAMKSAARDALVSYGDEVLPALAHFLNERSEQVWVRRHIPSVLAFIPSQQSMDVLVNALDDRDGFLRFKVVVAIEKLRRDHQELTFARAARRGAAARRDPALLRVPDAAPNDRAP